MILKTFLLLSALSIIFWLGWRAHLCWWLNNFGAHRNRGVRVPFDERIWLERLSAPAVAMIVWSLLGVYSAARGWL